MSLNPQPVGNSQEQYEFLKSRTLPIPIPPKNRHFEILMRNFTHSTKLSSPASGGETPRRYAAWTTEKRNYAAAISGSNALSDTPPFPAILGRTQWTMMCLSSRLW